MKKLLMMMALVMASSAAYAEFKVAYVDVQTVVEKSKDGKKLNDELKKEFEKRQKEIEKKKADLDKMNEDIEKKKSVLSEEALQKRSIEFQGEVQKVREAMAKSQMEFQKKQNELYEPIIKKLKSIIEKVAKDKGYSMVIRSNQTEQIVLYAAAEHDLTDEVVSALDKDK